MECPSTSPPWCKDQGMRIPLDTGPLEEGRSNMSFDYQYTNFELIKFHDFPWLMLIFENFLSYSHFWDYQQSTKKHEYLSVSKNSQVFTSKLKDEVYVLSPRFLLNFSFIFYRFKSLGFSSPTAMTRAPTFIFESSWRYHFCPNKKSRRCSNI